MPSLRAATTSSIAFSILAVAASIAGPGACPASAQVGCPEFELEPLFGPQCEPTSWYKVSPTAINDHGDVVGSRSVCGFSTVARAIHWPLGASTYQLLPMPAGTIESNATGIDNEGRIVGTFVNPAFNAGHTAFVIEPDGTFMAILAPSKGNWTEGRGTGNGKALGVTVGMWSNVITGPQRPARWKDGVLTDLLGEVPYDAMNGVANAVNAHGQITGHVDELVFPGTQAFLWTEGRMELLGVIPGPGGITSRARDINVHAEIVGDGHVVTRSNPGGQPQPFHWANGVMTRLPLLPGDQWGLANALNDDEWVVGRTEKPNGQRIGMYQVAGVLWRNGRIRDVNDFFEFEFGYRIVEVRDVTNTGWLLCSYREPFKSGGARLRKVRESADLDCDGEVDGEDLALLLQAWGSREPGYADIDGDGVVAASDLGVLLGQWSELKF